MKRITVIVPVYRVEAYLRTCVESILAQTYDNLEIILVDDGSPDNSGRLCEELALEDPRIRVIHKENGGLGYARNTGLDAATGDYVTFIDSDDWITKDHIENLCKALEETGSQLSIGGFTISYEPGVYGSAVEPGVPAGVYENEAIRDQIVLPIIGPDVDYPIDVQLQSSSCMNLYDLELIRSSGLRFLSERYAESEDLYFNIDYLQLVRRLVVTGEVGYCYRENSGSLSRKYHPERFRRTLHYYEELQKRVEQYGLAPYLGHRLERSYLTRIRVAVRHAALSELPFREQKQVVRQMLEHPLTVQTLAAYPIGTLIPAIRLFAVLMQKRQAGALLLMMKFREGARSSDLLRKAMKKLGVGR